MTRRVEAGMPIGEWVLEEKLGQGTFGEVWRARHRGLRDRLAAIKLPRDPGAVERLVAEGTLLARLPIRIPGAVALLGCDAEHEPPYLALEYVEGESLRARLSRGPLAPERAVSVTRAVLETLRSAHRIGVIHRDVKPENVLIDATGRVVLTDFGLATARHDSATVSASSSMGSEERAVVGTLRYMAPEQRDGRSVDHRADLFATGLVFFEMLVGTLPEGCEVPSELRPTLEPAFDDFFRGCHARLERRFADASAALASLGRVEAVIAGRRAAAARAESFARRLVETRSPPAACARSLEAPQDPNVIGWDEARAILRIGSPDLRRWIETGGLKRIDRAGRPLFRRGDVVELRDKLRRAKPPLPAPPPVAVAPPARPVVVVRGPARPPRVLSRSIAVAVDAVIACALASAVSGWAAVAVGGPIGALGLAVARPPVAAPFAASAAATIFVGALYVILSTWIFARTMGQWFVGIRVAGPDGGGVGFVRSATRLALMPFSALPLGAGLVGIVLDPEARALHDALTGTRVVFED